MRAQLVRDAAADAPVWRLCCFAGSLLAALIALVSPVDALADQLFFMHMVQHMLLLDLVPILAILGLTKVILRPRHARRCAIWSASAGAAGPPRLRGAAVRRA